MSDLFDALAEEDANTVVPAHVHHAVMRAWETRQQQPAPVHTWWARRRAWAAAAAGLVIVLAGAWLWPDDGRVPTDPPAVAYSEREVTAEYALVVDPDVEAATLSVMRVRLSGAVLAALGVPVQPDAAGMVEVELVVGEDGIARAIRGIPLAPYGASQASQE
jgi:hypothetical protein